MSARPTWLITGASGFLGANIGAYLSGRAVRIALTRTGATPAQFDHAIAGDLADPDAIVPLIEELRPAVLVNAGAMASHEACETNPDLAEQINAIAPGALASTAARIGARFVQISTDAVFDGERGGYNETDAPSPTSVYGHTKLAGERNALQVADALVIRTNFFGWSPSGRRSILEFFVNELGAGNPVRGFTDFTTTSAYAPVLVEAMWDLIDREAAGLFHVTSPDALTKYEFGIAVAREFELDSDLISPTRADIHPPRNGDISLDVSKVQDMLGRPLSTQIQGISAAHRDAATLRSLLRAPAGS